MFRSVSWITTKVSLNSDKDLVAREVNDKATQKGEIGA